MVTHEPPGFNDEFAKIHSGELALGRDFRRRGNGNGEAALTRLDIESPQKSQVPIDDVRPAAIRADALRVEKSRRPLFQVARAESDASVAAREEG